MLPANINSSDRGAIQFLYSMQVLLDTDDAKTRHSAASLIQTAIALSCGSPTCLPDGMAGLEAFLSNGDERVSRFGAQFLSKLASIPDEMDTDFMRDVASDLAKGLERNANFGDEAAMLGKFGVVILSSFFPFPVSKEYARSFEAVLLNSVPDLDRAQLERAIGAMSPYMKEKQEFVAKPDDWKPKGFRIRRRRGF